MKRKNPPLPEEEREKIRNIIEEMERKNLERRSRKETDEFHETYAEALKTWLPEWQKQFASGQSFVFLCLQLKLFLEKMNFKENQQALKLAKENFDSYCEKCLQEKIYAQR